MDDIALLHEYVTRHSEAAFEELVMRRIGFVYSAALRQVREPLLAEEITQAVFIILAQKAGQLSEKNVLICWLFKTTRFVALAQIRAATKRRQREQEANMQSEIQKTASDLFWEQMSPLLDEALAALGEQDRRALLLRFFDNKSLAAVGHSLGLGEDAARKRVSRALEKLHRYFKRRGISSTTAIIAGEISTNSVQAAPLALAKFVTTTAMAKGAAASTSTLTLVKGALKIMAWAKVKTAVFTGIGILLVTSTTAALWDFHSGKDSWRNRFDAVYKLNDGEVLRYIPPPFIDERLKYYQSEDMLQNQAKAVPRGPDSFVFRQNKNGQLQYSECFFGFKKHSLQQILDAPLGFWRYEFEASDGLLDLNLPGDWTILEGVDREDLLAALEPIIQKATGHRIHFEKRTVEREVIVAHGLAQSPPGPNAKIQIYAEKSNVGGGGMGHGNLQQLLGTVGEQVNFCVVNEARVNPLYANLFDWAYYPDSNFSKMGSRREELTEKVLQNLTRQTGLAFTHERRPVGIWFVTEQ